MATRIKAWLLATRPKTLSAALVPMAVGSALAYRDTELFSPFLLVCAILSALCIQIGTNLVNDAIDYKKGADTAQRLGPKRMSQSGLLKPGQVLSLGILCLTFSLAAGIPLIIAGGWPIFWTIAISACMGYLYTGGPKPLSYNGFGDLFVFLFFGVVATAAMYYIQAHTLSGGALLAGIQVGLICTLMIVINNLRDVAEDTKSDKKTLVVRFGKKIGKLEIAGLIAAAYTLGIFWWAAGAIGLALWPLLTLPLALTLIKQVHATEPSAVYNVFLGQASVLFLLWGVTLVTGSLL